MFREKYSRSIKINIDLKETNIIAVLIDSLNYLGYKDINVNGNLIEFKSDKENEILRAFQSSFGNGDLNFDYKDNSLFLTITKNIRIIKRYITYVIYGLSLIGLIIVLFSSLHLSITLKLIISFAYLISFIINIYGDKSYNTYKLEDFLKRICDYLIKNNASHQQSV